MPCPIAAQAAATPTPLLLSGGEATARTYQGRSERHCALELARQAHIVRQVGYSRVLTRSRPNPVDRMRHPDFYGRDMHFAGLDKESMQLLKEGRHSKEERLIGHVRDLKVKLPGLEKEQASLASEDDGPQTVEVQVQVPEGPQYVPGKRMVANLTVGGVPLNKPTSFVIPKVMEEGRMVTLKVSSLLLATVISFRPERCTREPPCPTTNTRSLCLVISFHAHAGRPPARTQVTIPPQMVKLIVARQEEVNKEAMQADADAEPLDLRESTALRDELSRSGGQARLLSSYPSPSSTPSALRTVCPARSPESCTLAVVEPRPPEVTRHTR